MKTNAIPFELQGKVRKYLEHLMKKHQNSEKETAILDKLTNTLKKDVILQSNGKFLSQIPFLKKNFSNESLEELSFFMKKIQFCPEEYIFKMNQLDDCSIFLLASGNLETVLPVRDDIGKELKLNKLEKGELFGLASFFTDEPRLSSIKSNNFSTLFEIKKIDFMNIIKKRPNDFENYCMIRDKIKLYHNYEDISIKCHCCHKENHNLLHCPLLHYIPDSEFLISRANYSKNQERTLSFSRKTKKKFNSLGDRLIILQDLMKMSSEYFSNDSLSDISEEMQNKEIIPEKNSVSITETNNFQEKCIS